MPKIPPTRKSPSSLIPGTRVVITGTVSKVWRDGGRAMVTVVVAGTGHRETMPVDPEYVRADE